MPDTRPRNTEGQFSPETGGGSGSAAFQAAYNPAIIMQNNEQRQAILAAVQKRKQDVEGSVPSGPSNTVLSRRLARLVEFATAQDSPKKQNSMGTLAGFAAPLVASSLVGIPTLAVAKGNGEKAAANPVYDHIARNAKKSGINVHKSNSAPGFAWNHEGKSGFFADRMKEAIGSMTSDGGQHSVKGVAIGENVRNSMRAGILAHEVGHVSRNSFLHSGIPHGMAHLGSASSLYVAGTGNQDRGRNAAVIGTLATLPVMGSEIEASVRGHSILSKAHAATKVPMGLLDHAKPFVGLPSYAAMAAAPALAYEVKKHLGGYRQKNKASGTALSRRLARLVELATPQRDTNDQKLRDTAVKLAGAGAGAGLGFGIGAAAHHIDSATSSPEGDPRRDKWEKYQGMKRTATESSHEAERDSFEKGAKNWKTKYNLPEHLRFPIFGRNSAKNGAIIGSIGGAAGAAYLLAKRADAKESLNR